MTLVKEENSNFYKCHLSLQVAKSTLQKDKSACPKDVSLHMKEQLYILAPILHNLASNSMIIRGRVIWVYGMESEAHPSEKIELPMVYFLYVNVSFYEAFSL